MMGDNCNQEWSRLSTFSRKSRFNGESRPTTIKSTKMGGFFRKLFWCGCPKSSRHGKGSNEIETVETGETSGLPLLMADHNSDNDNRMGDVAKHFQDLADIRFIDEEEQEGESSIIHELDGPNAEQIQDAWVIAVERGARERLQRLTSLRRIQPRDIQAILYQQISEGVASTSGAPTGTDLTNSQITITLANKELGTNAFPTKLSNGTIPKGIAKDKDSKEIKDDISKERKDCLEKQQSCPEEANLLQPLQNTRTGERRASSPFQNGRTEVLIGDPEGGPRSPRGSTSSAANDSNFLNPPEERDYPEPICSLIYQQARLNAVKRERWVAIPQA